MPTMLSARTVFNMLKTENTSENADILGNVTVFPKASAVTSQPDSNGFVTTPVKMSQT